MVDDNPFFAEAWKRENPSVDIHCFQSPEQLIRFCAQHSWREFDYIIIDMHFGKFSDMTGLELARIVKSSSDALTVLSSFQDLEDLPGPVATEFDYVVENKIAVNLMKLVNGTKAKGSP